MLRIALAALAISLAAFPAAAQEATGPDPVAVAAFQQKASLYSMLLLDSRALTLDMVERIGSVQARAPFDSAWAGEARARAASLRARIAQAPPIPAAELIALYPPGSPNGAKAAALVERYPEIIRETLVAGLSLIDKTAELGPRVQTGDEAASLALAGAMFGGMKSAMAAENLQLELGATSYTEGHPQRALTESSVASNRAMIEFFSMMQGEAEGRNVNMVGAARRIRANAEESRRMAETVPRLAAAMTLDLDAAARSGGTTLAPEDRAAFDSYRTSAANEIAITDYLGTVALSLAEEGLHPGVEEALAEIEALLERRIELNQRRLRTLAQ